MSLLIRPQKISQSSIKKYLKNISERAGYYMLGIKPKVFYKTMEVGSAVHKAIELYNKGEEDENILYKTVNDYLILSAEKGTLGILKDGELDDLGSQGRIALYNFLKREYKRLDSEVISSADIGLPFPLYAIADAKDYKKREILDYKIVKSFTNPEQQPTDREPITKYMEYKIQAWENALIAIHLGEKVEKIVFREILKSDGSVNSETIKVDDLLILCRKKHGDDISLVDENGKKLTKEKLVEKYDPKTETIKDIVFDATPEWLAEGYDFLEKVLTEMDELCNKKGAI